MKNFALLSVSVTILFGISLAATSAAQKKGGQKDRKKLQGTWTAKQGDASAELVIKGRKFTMKITKGGETHSASGSFRIDPSQNPSSMDMKILAAKGEETKKYIGKTALAIYKVEGKVLTWCANEPGREGRPKAFVRREGDRNYLLLSFKRKKK